MQTFVKAIVEFVLFVVHEDRKDGNKSIIMCTCGQENDAFDFIKTATRRLMLHYCHFSSMYA